MSAPVPPVHATHPPPAWLRFLKEWSVPAVVLVIAGGAISMGIGALNDRFTSVSATVSNVNHHVEALDTTVTASNASNATLLAALTSRLDQRFDRSEDDIKDGVKMIVAAEIGIKDSVEKIRLSMEDLHQKVDKISAKVKVNYVPEEPSGATLDLIAGNSVPTYASMMAGTDHWGQLMLAGRGSSEMTDVLRDLRSTADGKLGFEQIYLNDRAKLCAPVDQLSQGAMNQFVGKLQMAGIKVVFLDPSRIGTFDFTKDLDKGAIFFNSPAWKGTKFDSAPGVVSHP